MILKVFEAFKIVDFPTLGSPTTPSFICTLSPSNAYAVKKPIASAIHYIEAIGPRQAFQTAGPVIK